MAVSLPSSLGSGQSMTNYARLGHAAQQLLPEILQDLIACQKSQNDLEKDVLKNNDLRRLLYISEITLIQNAKTNGYANFDVLLIYKLVRNLKLVPDPSQTWESQTAPNPSEKTPGDDLERFRHARNAIVHRGNANVTDAEMNYFFSMFKDVAGRLEKFLGKQQGDYVKKFEQLETCCIDEKTEKMYLQALEDLRQRESDLTKKVNDVSMEVKENTKKVNDVSMEVKENTKKVNDVSMEVKENTKKVNDVSMEVKENTKKVNDVNMEVKENTTDIVNIKDDMADIRKKLNANKSKDTEVYNDVYSDSFDSQPSISDAKDICMDASLFSPAADRIGERFSFDCLADGVLLYSEDDREAAGQFIKNIKQDMPDLNVTLWLYEQWGVGESLLRSASKVFDTFRFLFIFVTTHFESSDLERFQGEIALIESIKNPTKQKRVIPVLAQKDFYISEFVSLQSLKYYRYLEAKAKNKSDDFFLITCQNLIIQGRKQYLAS